MRTAPTHHLFRRRPSLAQTPPRERRILHATPLASPHASISALAATASIVHVARPAALLLALASSAGAPRSASHPSTPNHFRQQQAHSVDAITHPIPGIRAPS